jgi:hypothetical protein
MANPGAWKMIIAWLETEIKYPVLAESLRSSLAERQPSWLEARVQVLNSVLASTMAEETQISWSAKVSTHNEAHIFTAQQNPATQRPKIPHTPAFACLSLSKAKFRACRDSQIFIGGIF